MGLQFRLGALFMIFGMLFISQMNAIYPIRGVFCPPQNPIIKCAHTHSLWSPLSSFVCSLFLQHLRYEKWMSLSIYSAIHFSRGLYH